MHRLLKGIDGLDRHGAGCALSSFGDASDVTEQHLVEALDLLPGLVDRHADKFETSDRGRIIGGAALALTRHGVEFADGLHLGSRPPETRFVSFDKSFVRLAARAGVFSISSKA